MATGGNIGFDEVKAMEALENINKNYKQMMSAVDAYQKAGIDVVCENWKSNKGKESITQLVDKLNIVLEKTTTNLGLIFDAVNKKAEAIDRDSDGIGYNAVAFEAQDNTFSASKAQNDADNGKVAQWDLNGTNKGVEKIKSFLQNRVHKNMDEIEVEMYNLESAFNYSEYGKSISGALHKITSKMETYATSIEKYVNTWEEVYQEDAKAHGQNVEEMANDTNLNLDLDF